LAEHLPPMLRAEKGLFHLRATRKWVGRSGYGSALAFEGRSTRPVAWRIHRLVQNPKHLHRSIFGDSIQKEVAGGPAFLRDVEDTGFGR
jgi:hypothetical protein